MKHSGLTLMEK